MSGMQVRLLVNTVSKKILYMEAGKELVDLLLGFLQLPVGTILNVFNQEAEPIPTKLEVGSISNIYESLLKMSDSNLVVAKDGLLNPPSSLQLTRESRCELLLSPSTKPPSLVFRCGRSSSHLACVSRTYGAVCKQCTKEGYTGSMSTEMTFADDSAGTAAGSKNLSPAESTRGYVQSYLSFIVTDELRVLPASTIESIVLLSKLKVDNLSDLDSIETVITADEALELLKVSFTTRSALNQVFGRLIPGIACADSVLPKKKLSTSLTPFSTPL